MMTAVRKILAMVAMANELSSTTLFLRCWTRRSSGEKAFEVENKIEKPRRASAIAMLLRMPVVLALGSEEEA